MTGRGRSPDFIIGGAMKSGTSSVHRHLANRPDVFIPHGEIHFFDLDDAEQHPDYHEPGRPLLDYDQNREEYLAWYRGHFAEAEEGRLVGEDSTTYLASLKAPDRIRALLPDVRLVFCLRDPVARAYSHYWHMVRVHRLGCSFEKALRRDATILQRGFYRPQLERYLARFPAEHILVIQFERLVREPESELRRLWKFLGLPALSEGDARLPHDNRSVGYRSASLALLYNRVTAPLRPGSYLGHFPGFEGRPDQHRTVRLLDRLERRVNRRPGGSYTRMDPATEAWLRDLFRRENRGMETLVDFDAGLWKW